MMAICIVIPTINNGNGWGSYYTPPELRCAYAYYRRIDKAANMNYAFKEYFTELQEVMPTMDKDGHTFHIYAIEQDGVRERVEYNSKTNRYKFTGDYF